MNTRRPEKNEERQLLGFNEDHFRDRKSVKIRPAKAQESFVAFANADGGDLYIGVEDDSVNSERIDGFADQEDANNLIGLLLEDTKPSVENVDTEFVDFGNKGLVLHFSIPKSPKVHYTSTSDCYLRVNASTRKIRGENHTVVIFQGCSSV